MTAPRVQRIRLARQLPVSRVSETALPPHGLRPGTDAQTTHSHHIHDEVLVDYCDAGTVWDPVLSAYFYRFDPATRLLARLFPSSATAGPSTSNLTSFLYYTGLWGDAKYPDDHPLQKTVPYFGLKRFVSGPEGPLAKQLVRQGLFPDDRGTRSWTQRAVGVLMALYPCCLRGWRKWVALASLACVAVAAALSLRHGVRRCRRVRGYRKLDTEIPLGDVSAAPLLRSSQEERRR